MRRKILGLLVMIVCVFGTGITSVYAVTGSDIVTEARNYLGAPYVWGGASPSGFDCSGLVQYVCNRLGISMAKTTYDQIYYGTAIDYSSFKSSFNYSNLQLGDLIFFDYEGDGAPDHVGIYSGNGNMIDALNSNYYGKQVVEHSINVTGNSSISATKKFWQYTCGIRRVASGGNDTTPPTITSLIVTNKSTSSFTVNCTANETLSRAYMIVYGPGGNSGNGFDINNINSTSFSKKINTSDYGGTGDYTVHVYVFDSAGNEGAGSTGGFTIDKLNVNSFTASSITPSSFTIRCNSSQIISRAYVIVYGPGGNSGNGFDIYNVNSTSFSKTINTGDYGGAGDYTVHVYVFDSSGNEAAASTGGFSVPSLKVNSYTVSNITDTSFVLNGNTNYSISRAYIIVYGPGGNSGQGFDIYDINSTSFSKKINISDYGGQGSYVAHLYVFDSAGNSAPAATGRFYVPQSLAPLSTSTTATRTNGAIEVQTTISNLTESASCVKAVYSADGTLLGQSSTDVDSRTNSTTAYFPNYPNASYVKVFLWDSLKGMKPLTNCEKVTL